MFQHSSTNHCTFHEKCSQAVRQPDKKLLLSLSLYHYPYHCYCHYHYNYRCHYHHCFTIFVQFCLIVRHVFDKCQLSFFFIAFFLIMKLSWYLPTSSADWIVWKLCKCWFIHGEESLLFSNVFKKKIMINLCFSSLTSFENFLKVSG